jgi:preprotein translocase subunit SecD
VGSYLGDYLRAMKKRIGFGSVLIALSLALGACAATPPPPDSTPALVASAASADNGVADLFVRAEVRGGARGEKVVIPGKGELELESRSLALVAVLADVHGRDVSIQLSPESAKEFERFTEGAVGRKVVLFAKGKAVAAPLVRDAIRGGQVMVSTDSDEEAQRIGGTITKH